MRLLACILAAGVLAPAALAFPVQEGQKEKQEPKDQKEKEKQKEGEKGKREEKPGGAPDGRGFGANFEAKDFEEIGVYADGLAAAELDDETTGELLVLEVSAKRMRGRARGPGGEGAPGDAGPRPEPISTFVKAKIVEGKKGADLAAAIKAETERRRAEAGPGGEGPMGGRGGERAEAHRKAMREAAMGIVKKLRAEKVKGKAFAEAFIKEQRAKVEKMREERTKEREKGEKEGEKPEKPRDGEKKDGA
ncbi:MAG TPA: hypothetical protein VFI25_16245 [Planctomycetota bacterium]|nr:hypothetical protein [Planctomycetota bacterium]